VKLRELLFEDEKVYYISLKPSTIDAQKIYNMTQNIVSQEAEPVEKKWIDYLHTTLIYSKGSMPTDFEDKSKKVVSFKASIVGFHTFPHTSGKKYLVLDLKCPSCDDRFNELISLGAKTDFPNYKAHITFVYDFGKSKESVDHLWEKFKKLTNDPNSELFGFNSITFKSEESKIIQR
jgi:hypothetical protein